MTPVRIAVRTAAAVLALAPVLAAQLTDVKDAPNAANAGIQKSYQQQIGAGRGDLLTPESSLYLIGRDPFRSIVRGRQLFQRKFNVSLGLGPRTNDGRGAVDRDPSVAAGFTDSCAACHGRPRGSAGVGGNVFTRPDSRDAPHLFGLGLVEMLADEITGDLRGIRAAAVERATRLNRSVTVPLRSKGIGYGTLVALPNGDVDTSQVDGVDPDLRVRPFFAEGTTISIREFIVGALNAEMGLEAVDPITWQAAHGEDVRTPTGMLLSGSIDRIESPIASDEWDDPDGDGVVHEVPGAIVDHLEMYLTNYFKPATYEQTAFARAGEYLMRSIGCTECHVPDLVIEHDRRVADVETGFDPTRNGINRLFATAIPLFDEVQDERHHPTLKRPRGDRFIVRGIYADFKRHDLGPGFWERDFDGGVTKEFMTEPLWGVGTTAPYGHDGRSINLREVILRHGGEALASRRGFEALPELGQRAVLEFLQTLVLFPPPDTASNLDPAQPGTPGFPYRGHGSIELRVLFNNPGDPE